MKRHPCLFWRSLTLTTVTSTAGDHKVGEVIARARHDVIVGAAGGTPPIRPPDRPTAIAAVIPISQSKRLTKVFIAAKGHPLPRIVPLSVFLFLREIPLKVVMDFDAQLRNLSPERVRAFSPRREQLRHTFRAVRAEAPEVTNRDKAVGLVFPTEPHPLMPEPECPIGQPREFRVIVIVIAQSNKRHASPSLPAPVRLYALPLHVR